MRYAVSQSGEVIDAYTVKPMRIATLAPFSCPVCGEAVTVRQGAKRRLHFAHLHACGGVESVGHQTDKWHVRQWLQNSGYRVDQEVTIGPRRADLVGIRDENRLVVEIQASPLAVDTYRERTFEYARRGYDVIWLASGLALERGLLLKPWMRLELARRHGLYVMSHSRLYRFVGFPISIRRGQGRWVRVDDDSCSPFESYYTFDGQRWSEVVRRKRMMPSYPTKRYRTLVLERLYPLGMLPSLFPTFVYLPLTCLWSVPIHPFEFQAVFYLNRRMAPRESFEWSVEKTCHQFGVVPSSDFCHSFHVQWSQLVAVCRQSEDVRDWHVPKTLEEALRHDVRWFQGFQRFMAKSLINQEKEVDTCQKY